VTSPQRSAIFGPIRGINNVQSCSAVCACGGVFGRIVPTLPQLGLVSRWGPAQPVMEEWAVIHARRTKSSRTGGGVRRVCFVVNPPGFAPKSRPICEGQASIVLYSSRPEKSRPCLA
jgi:hypothetical protein